MTPKRIGFIAAVIAVLSGGGYAIWLQQTEGETPPGFARSNGRIEADRIDIAAKFPGRIKEILVDEGDRVKAGETLAKMDASEMLAQIDEAEAAVRQSNQQHRRAMAELARRYSELEFAHQELSRATRLFEKGHVSTERVQQRRTEKDSAKAAHDSAKAGTSEAVAAVEAALARVARLKADLDDYTLKAPRDGRVQYRLAEPGEVLASGGKVLTILDLTDVYMTIFLSTRDAGRVAMGAEARIVLDAVPDYVIPARVTFVAAEAQFTPRYVETEKEREKLVFRVKVQIPRELLERYADRVKTGVPGVATVRVEEQAKWPEALTVKLPE